MSEKEFFGTAELSMPKKKHWRLTKGRKWVMTSWKIMIFFVLHQSPVHATRATAEPRLAEAFLLSRTGEYVTAEGRQQSRFESFRGCGRLLTASGNHQHQGPRASFLVSTATFETPGRPKGNGSKSLAPYDGNGDNYGQRYFP